MENTNKVLMDICEELEREAGQQERKAGYKRTSKGIAIRKRGIAKGLRIAAARLRSAVVPSFPLGEGSEYEIDVAEIEMSK